MCAVLLPSYRCEKSLPSNAITVKTDWLFKPQSGYPGCRQAEEAVAVRGLLLHWRLIAQDNL